MRRAAAALPPYRVRRVTGDRYAGEWPREQFRAHAIQYDLAPLDRSALYLALLPVVNSGRVELPNEPALLRELRSLERRRGPSGRDRVDHPPGAHDDRANAVAGVSALEASASARWRLFAGRFRAVAAGVSRKERKVPR